MKHFIAAGVCLLAFASPAVELRARLGIFGEQRLDLRAHDAKVVGVGR